MFRLIVQVGNEASCLRRTQAAEYMGGLPTADTLLYFSVTYLPSVARPQSYALIPVS